MATLELNNLSKVYDGAGERAVDSVTMHIEDGEIIALLGSSGCGKTTTLRMVAGLETVTEGEIRVGDRVVNTVRPSQRMLRWRSRRTLSIRRCACARISPSACFGIAWRARRSRSG